MCGSKELTELFSLGEQYISDFVEDPLDAGVKLPITLDQCSDCSLVQARYTPPPELLYRKFYWYRSGVTDSMRAALNDVVEQAIQTVDLEPGDRALDIGSNDGTLLRCYPKGLGLCTIGVEPAENLAEDGSEGVDFFLNDFWEFQKLWDYHVKVQRHMDKDLLPCKVITAIGMFYDLDNPNQFIADVAKALHPEGVFISQLMTARFMLDSLDVGNLCHEHLEYYTLKSLDRLFTKHELEIFDVERNDVNGGSYRIYARLKGSSVNRPGAEERLGRLINEELSELDLCSPGPYLDFYQEVCRNRDLVFDFVRECTRKNKSVWVLGASTKGNVVLQFCGLDSRFIMGASERSPEKYDKYTVGTGIPIYDEESARRANPDYFLVLPYSFLSELMEREKAWRSRGGRFIIPIPKLSIMA